jgi:hypothetical protein
MPTRLFVRQAGLSQRLVERQNRWYLVELRYHIIVELELR